MQSYQHFTLDERESLQEMIREGKSQAEIARELGRSPSSVSREIKRNQNKDGRYHPWRATCQYLHRRKACKRKPRLADEKAFVFVKSGLDVGWSPEIISERWKMEHSDEKLSVGTIYRAIKKEQLPGYTRKRHLRRHGKRKHNHNTQVISPTHTIHERPEIVELRGRFGDLEGDTVSGAIGKGCVVTLVDRKSRMLYAALCKSRDNDEVAEAFECALGDTKTKSITLDRGSEFAKFKKIEKALKTTIYFADPHSPWQRPTNENTNGLLRFYYPKGTDFTAVTEEEFQNVISLINTRPRKCLGWISPLEFISSKCCT